jgi:hypothetical protein
MAAGVPPGSDPIAEDEQVVHNVVPLDVFDARKEADTWW